MANSVCVVPTWPEVVRFTLLDGCGRPLYGPSSQFVTDAFNQVEISTDISEGDTFELDKANGGKCCSKKKPDAINFDTWTFDLCAVDAEMWASLNDNFMTVRDFSGRVIGYDEPYSLQSNNSAFVELFVNTCEPEGDECAEDAQFITEGQWVWIGGGRLMNWRGGDTQTYSGDAQYTQLIATSQKGNFWGTGPYPVLLDNTGNPAPWAEPYGREALKSRRITNLVPPKPRCGAQPLSNPAGPKFDIFCTGDDGGRSIAVRLTDDVTPGATYFLDWGDGSGTTVIQPGQLVQHTYSEEFVRTSDFTYVSVWNANLNALYTAVEISLPCQAPTITVAPTSGEAPLSVVANVEGCADDSTMTVDFTNQTEPGPVSDNEPIML